MSFEQRQQESLNNELFQAVREAQYRKDPLLDRMRELIDLGADINAKRFEHGATMLHEAATYGERDMAYRLMFLGADPNVLDNDGKTPLHQAVAAGTDLIGPLLISGADINARDNDGRTSLHLAYATINDDAIQALKQRGADQSMKDNDGLTAHESGPGLGERIKFNVDDKEFTFYGKRWEDLKTSEERVDALQDTYELKSQDWGNSGWVKSHGRGNREWVANEHDRLLESLRDEERVDFWEGVNANELAKQGYNSQEEYDAAVELKAELDGRSESGWEKHTEDYYEAQEIAHVAWEEFNKPAAVAQRLNDELEADTAQVAAWSPSPKQAESAVSQDDNEPETQEHTYRRTQRL